MKARERCRTAATAAVSTAVSTIVIIASALAPGLIATGSAFTLLRVSLEAAVLLLVLVRPLWVQRTIAGCARVLLVVAYLHVARVLSLRRRNAAVSLSVATATWIVLAITGARLVPGTPVAADDVVRTAFDQTTQAVIAATDRASFGEEIANDPYADTDAADLLSGLRGNDVVTVFVESYGEVALRDSSFASGVDEVLRAGSAELAEHGHGQRSALLTSPTFGGVSWLAHSTLQSGLWIDSQRRYDQVTESTRLTLSSAFRDAGWRTVSDIPSNTMDWAVGRSSRARIRL